MRRALELAMNGQGYTNPNPLVGAVIVKDEKIIGEGYHEMFGQAHAEVNAVNSSKEDLEGATIYVTLEPCCHYGKTPPCVELIKKRKFKKVVVGALDPNQLVAGKGIKILEDAGIEVKVGVLKEECEKLNEIFNYYIENKRPFVGMKWAMTLDGKIATRDFKSKWITNEKSREFVHELRKKYSSIMVGINTILKDNPDLRCRKKNELDNQLKEHRKRNHFRVVIDSKLRIPLNAKVLENQEESKTLIFTTDRKDEDKELALRERGIEVIEILSNNSRVDISKVLEVLGEKNIDSVLVEGGGTLNFSFLESEEVNKVYAFIAPKIFGGESALSPVEGIGIREVIESFKLKNIEVKNFDNDVLVEGVLK